MENITFTTEQKEQIIAKQDATNAFINNFEV